MPVPKNVAAWAGSLCGLDLTAVSPRASGPDQVSRSACQRRCTSMKLATK